MDATTEIARVLDAVDTLRDPMLEELRAVLRVPSISGTDAENEAQQHMGGVLADGGMDIDLWQIDLPTISAHPDFPGMEVDRAEAWGLVGLIPGTDRDSARTLMLNGHIDVVPTGDADAWTDAPFGASIRDGRLYGRARAT